MEVSYLYNLINEFLSVSRGLFYLIISQNGGWYYE
jgi:hypothetical protein